VVQVELVAHQAKDLNLFILSTKIITFISTIQYGFRSSLPWIWEMIAAAWLSGLSVYMVWAAIQKYIMKLLKDLGILRAVFIRCSFMSEDGSDGFDSSGLGSSPIYPLVASFNDWSRFSGFFLSTLINLTMYNIANNTSSFFW
jgi:hypothetical protein